MTHQGEVIANEPTPSNAKEKCTTRRSATRHEQETRQRKTWQQSRLQKYEKKKSSTSETQDTSRWNHCQ